MDRVRGAVAGWVADLGPRRRGLQGLIWARAGRVRLAAPTAAEVKALAASLVAQLRVLIDFHIVSAGLNRDITLRLAAAALTVAILLVALAAAGLRRRRRRAAAAKKRLSFKDAGADAPEPQPKRIARQQTPARGTLKNIAGALKKEATAPCPPVQKPFTSTPAAAAAAAAAPAPASPETAEMRRVVGGLISAVDGLVAWKEQSEAALAAAADDTAAAKAAGDAAAAAGADATEAVKMLSQTQFTLERVVQGLVAWRVEAAAAAAARPAATKLDVSALAADVEDCCAKMAALSDAQVRLAADVEARVGAADAKVSALALRGRRASATRAVRVSPTAVGRDPATSELAKSERALEELVESMAGQRPGPSGSGAGKKEAGGGGGK